MIRNRRSFLCSDIASYDGDAPFSVTARCAHRHACLRHFMPLMLWRDMVIFHAGAATRLCSP